MAENEEPSIVEPRKNRTVQLRPADLDAIELVRRKFADGVKDESGLGNTNAEDLDLLRLGLRVALLPEMTPRKLATEMASLRAEIRANRNLSRSSPKESPTAV